MAMSGFAALLFAGPAIADADVSPGRRIAEVNCSPCHAIDRIGESPNPKSPPFRTLAKRYPLEDLEEALAEGIVVGHNGAEMPQFQLTPAQIDRLLAYIKSISDQ